MNLDELVFIYYLKGLYSKLSQGIAHAVRCLYQKFVQTRIAVRSQGIHPPMSHSARDGGEVSTSAEPLYLNNVNRSVWLVKVCCHLCMAFGGTLPFYVDTSSKDGVSNCAHEQSQVPNFLAKKWRAACDQAARSQDKEPVELGKIRIKHSASQVGWSNSSQR